MTGTTQSYNFRYQALAAYSFSTAPTGPFQIIETGMSDCPLAPPPPTAYTYEWKVGEYGTCGGMCGTNGTRTRTVKCQRSDGLYVNDSSCTATKPITTQSCSMAACQPSDTSCSVLGYQDPKFYDNSERLHCKTG
jgi:hypothetical protein